MLVVGDFNDGVVRMLSHCFLVAREERGFDSCFVANFSLLSASGEICSHIQSRTLLGRRVQTHKKLNSSKLSPFPMHGLNFEQFILCSRKNFLILVNQVNLGKSFFKGTHQLICINCVTLFVDVANKMAEDSASVEGVERRTLQLQ